MRSHFSGLVLLGLAACALVWGQDTTTHAHHHRPHLRTVCYVAGWAHYRPDPVQFHPEDVNTDLCTHLMYAFALLDPTGQHLIAADSVDPIMYQRLVALKREKPSLKVMLSVGGWNLGSEEFSKMVSSEAHMHAFAGNAIAYLHRYGFDGLDVDWEYPADRGSPPGDKQRFTRLLQILKKEFGRDHATTSRTRLILSAAISPAPNRINMSFELPEIADPVDFLNLMTYDMHGSWETTLGHHSTLYSPNQNENDSIDFVVNWILNSTVAPQKLNLGLAFYGRTLNLSDPTNSQIGAAIAGPGHRGSLTKEDGVLAYYEVCKLLTEQNDTISDSGRLPGLQSPYVVDGSRWTGYDDVNSIKEKVEYAVESGLGGVFIWAIDFDDFHGICGGGHYPLLNAIKDQLHQSIIGR